MELAANGVCAPDQACETWGISACRKQCLATVGGWFVVRFPLLILYTLGSLWAARIVITLYMDVVHRYYHNNNVSQSRKSKVQCGWRSTYKAKQGPCLCEKSHFQQKTADDLMDKTVSVLEPPSVNRARTACKSSHGTLLHELMTAPFPR